MWLQSETFALLNVSTHEFGFQFSVNFPDNIHVYTYMQLNCIYHAVMQVEQWLKSPLLLFCMPGTYLVQLLCYKIVIIIHTHAHVCSFVSHCRPNTKLMQHTDKSKARYQKVIASRSSISK